jgi:hypothetical protein
MQDDLMDDMIRDAAEQNQPPAEDKAWKLMHKKLNIHLPQKKSGRRYLFLLLIWLLSAGGLTGAGWWAYDHWSHTNPTLPSTKQPVSKTGTPSAESGNRVSSSTNSVGKDDNPIAGMNTTDQQPPANFNVPATPANTIASNTGAPDNTSFGAPVSIPQQSNTSPAIQKPVQYKRRRSAGKTVVRITNPATALSGTANPDTEVTDMTNGNTPATTVVAESKHTISTTIVAGTADSLIADGVSKTNNIAIATTDSVIIPAGKEINEADKSKPVTTGAGEKSSDTSSLQTTPQLTKTPSDKKKKRSGFANNIAFTFTTGIDLSYVRLSNPGTATALYGTGISYSMGKRWRISTGYYVANKIYNAAPSDYHPPANFWSVYATLDEVAAICRVEEIPLSLAYHFGKHPKHSWFVSIGVSSVLMRKEDYTYYYKPINGQRRTKQWIYEKEHQHFLSNLTLSGGYQYRLNPVFSFLAESYFKTPLKGVGYGRVRLGSLGLALTAVVKPFAR